MAQAFDLVVDGGVLFDEGVGMGDIGLGLIIVVIADEILHRVFREEFPEFAAELRRQDLVVRQHQGRPVQTRNDIGHGEGLARAGHAEQNLFVNAVFDALDQGVDGLGLVSHGLKIRMKPEMIHVIF